MKEWFSLRTVRKKILMLSKLTGLTLILFYILCTSLPVSGNASFLIWLGSLLLLVLGIDGFMSRFISRPAAELNAAAKRMARLDFSAGCTVTSSDEFGELSVSLNTMSANLQQTLARLENSLSERKELTDQLSHEMKTPLGIIRAYAEGLQDETDEAKKQVYAQVIISEAERMNDLIVTLLDLSGLESGAANLQITRFDLAELVETVAGRLLIDAPDIRFELQYVLPEHKAYVRTDQRRMEQVLRNLMVNAKKHVQPGGVLRLELTEKADAWHFSVFNQGRTIPENDLPKIWTKFYRGRTDSGGSGLGLSIVAQILSMQKLPYGAENRTDGVCFWFSIPAAESFHTDFTETSL